MTTDNMQGIQQPFLNLEFIPLQSFTTPDNLQNNRTIISIYTATAYYVRKKRGEIELVGQETTDIVYG